MRGHRQPPSLAALDDALDRIGEREVLLERLAPGPSKLNGSAVSAVSELEDGVVENKGHGGPPTSRSTQSLRGPAIRRVAVELLVENERIEALHYREWFALVEAAGFRIAGKDPLAVFLTQLSRSPAVRRSTRAGFYALDRQAPQSLRRALARLHSELRELTGQNVATPDLREVRRRRAELTSKVGQAERALEEAEAVLSRRARMDQLTGSSAA